MKSFLVTIVRLSSLTVIVFVMLVYLVDSGLIYADALFLHANIYNDPYVPRLTKGEAVNRWGKSLFDEPCFCTMAYFEEAGSYRPILFVSDKMWDRIVYGDKNQDWIRSWGRNGAEHERLFSPRGICALKEFETQSGGALVPVYVADQGVNRKSRILRLLYYSSPWMGNHFYYEDSLSYDTDERSLYEDMCVHDNSTVTDQADDYLWVVDGIREKIVKYNAFGDAFEDKGIQRTLTFQMGTGYGQLGHVGNIVCGRNSLSGANNDELYVLDPANSRLVRFIDNGTQAVFDTSYQFDFPALLTGLEIDTYGQLYVLDGRQGRLFKFNQDLELIDVFQPGSSSPGGMFHPVYLTNPRGWGDPRGWTDLFITEQWTDTTGGQWYQIGVKLMEQRDSLPNEYRIEIPYSASDPHLLYVDVYEKPGAYWVLYDTPYNGDLRYSGLSDITWSVFDTGVSRDYKFVVTGLSTYSGGGNPIDQFEFEFVLISDI